MSLTFARRLVHGALTLAVAVAATTLGATAAHAAVPRLALTALAFEQPMVDVTEEYAANRLTWTVTNTDPDATSIHGTVTMRMRSSVTGALVGHDWTVRYGFEETCCSDGVYESGTPQESTYSYYLPVRRYADASTATWEVTKVTISASDRSANISGTQLQSFGYRFTARTLIDTTGPTIQSIGLSPSRPPYFYVGNGPATVTYEFTAQDGESGFWKGTIRLAGPDGAAVTTPFTWERDQYSTGVRCGQVSGGDREATYMSCAIVVTLPASAAPGNWRIASLVLHNNAGGTTTYKSPTAPSITTTSNSTVQASDFAISPNPVNNWRDEVMVELTMSVTGARKGVSAVNVDFTGGCTQWGAPGVKADGRISVPVMVYRQTQECEVEGISVLDGAGNVALYGTAFGAPDPGLTITQVPSTNPPVALGATLNPSSLPTSEVGQRSVALTIAAEVQVAPINGIGVYLYDSDGTVVSQSFGGTSQADDGTVTHWLYLPWEGLAPGDYTVGFVLNDAARMSSAWNMPDRSDSRTLPGGPVVLTVTEG
ncbi:hypothetical protein DKT68_19025 [Micromonospora acroterricola]|uniref:Uncharacterized protein n=1 Tax=Micromonospora acroterricola TaxID=2202421 RepID=A0A317CXV7_9ACTN|nr:hypothetical protein [Micromonospora acroterricola]PWR07458.1 hypothetical protein DKT68_19025 [Micromonospora acroterricola]